MDDARLTEIERLTNDVRAAEEGNNPGGQNPKVMALCIGVANLVAEVRDLTAKVEEWKESDRVSLDWGTRQRDRAIAAEARVAVLEAQQASARNLCSRGCLGADS